MMTMIMMTMMELKQKQTTFQTGYHNKLFQVHNHALAPIARFRNFDTIPSICQVCAKSSAEKQAQDLDTTGRDLGTLGKVTAVSPVSVAHVIDITKCAIQTLDALYIVYVYIRTQKYSIRFLREVQS